MTVITIREQASPEGNAMLVFDGGEQRPITVTDPFSEAEEKRLEWYFEQHLRFPFTDQEHARKAAESVTAYGEKLFDQVFADRHAYARYQKAREKDPNNLTIEIAGSPEFHALHWEALKEPGPDEVPLALQATMVRRNLGFQKRPAEVRQSPTINLLLVTARPGGENDVNYRTISRPLVEGLQRSGVPVLIDMVRPGTYKALSDHLETVKTERGPGYYHVIHFDAHGALLTHAQWLKRQPPPEDEQPPENKQPPENEQPPEERRDDRYIYKSPYGRGKVEPYTGIKAFLSFEGEKEGEHDLVEAGELAGLLMAHGIPIVILNACQSGKQLRAPQSDAPQSDAPQPDGGADAPPVEARETSLGSRLMAAGVQLALAMGYSVTVSAAELLMRTLYDRLFAGWELPAAIRRGRQELRNDKNRRAYFRQTIELEDWLLPVVYQNAPVSLQPRPFTPEEGAAYYGRQGLRYRPPDTEYGFVGRDLDVLNVERRLLSSGPGAGNILLIRGLGGAGKSTLLHHLAHWWQVTGFVGEVFYFAWDERAWNRQQIMAAMAQKLLGEAAYHATFVPLGAAAQQAMLAAEWRKGRHLLILDNLESITGSHLAVKNTLPEDERARLHDFLRALAGAQSVVLLGSRGGEEWLKPGTFGENVYQLPGLDPQAASDLAELVLVRHNAERYRQDEDLRRLLALLDGYPLPIQVLLSNLARQTPAQVLAALQAGDEAVDLRSEKKTESILRSIDYSHANLEPEAQGLLACLAPFTSVFDVDQLERYSNLLQEQPALAELPYKRWPEVLQAAADWGLLRPHPNSPYHLQMQPTLTYFLRARLAAPETAATKVAIDTAFRLHYDGLGEAIADLMTSKEAREKELGQAMAFLEYENLRAAVELCLAAREPISGPYQALDEYWDARQEPGRALEVSAGFLEGLEAYPPELFSTREFGFPLHRLLGDMGRRQLTLKQYGPAEQSYRRTLEIATGVKDLDPELRGSWNATTYHQLGRVAEEQRQWAQAEAHYRQALAIFIEFKDGYNQGKVYHQLGTVAQEQRQWAQAEAHYRQALAIKIEFNDRYAQASTYHNLGAVAQEQRQWAQAEAHYRQALAIFVEFNDRYPQATVYHQLGRVAQAQRQWAQAEAHYRQALAIYIEFNDRYAQAKTYHQLGRVAEEQRQWAQAEAHYRQALAIFIEFGDRYPQATVYHQLGRVAEEQRQWAQAEAHYRQALAIKIEFNDRYAQASTYHQLGMVAQEQRQWAQAEAHYRQALAIFIEFKDRHGEGRVYHGFGRASEEQGQWAQARDYFLKALEIFASFRDEHSTDITLRSLSRLWQATEHDPAIPAAIAPILGISLEEAEELLRAAA